MSASAGFMLAVLAGTCASLASVSSKLALEGEGKTLRYVVPCGWMTELQCINVRAQFGAWRWYIGQLLAQVLIVIRSLCIILMLVFNAVMWNVFVKALQKSSSTVQATVINSASNFFCTVSSYYIANIQNIIIGCLRMMLHELRVYLHLYLINEL